jgi:uncharacterized protein (TIGR00255 family)
MAAASHAREQRFEVEAGADAEGRLLGLRARAVSDAGAYHVFPLTQALEPLGSTAILPGPYRTPAYAWEAVAVATNKPPLGAYRGVGMTMGVFVMERTLDLVAARLGLDPAEVRRRNLIPREAYPFRSASGMTYDSGDFPKALEQALALGDALALRGAPTVEWLLERPGVVTLGEPEAIAPEAGWPVLAEALARTMEELVARREAEGGALAKELAALSEALAAEVERMAQRVPAALAQRAARVRERIKALLDEHPLDEGRLAMEAAVWADKTDISEELARLKAHLSQFTGLLKEGGPVGRTLDFLVQELNREANTVASKANDLELSQLALAAKGHLEKIREQVQNVE